MPGVPDPAEPTPHLTARIGVLGVLTILTFGSWYYGFGVLLRDLKTDLHTSYRVLTLAYALAQLLSGAFGVAAGRVLDRRGARPLFAIGGITGATLFGLSTWMHTVGPFVVLYGLGGGLLGACGFYGVTITVTGRLATGTGHEARSIARLTIWGAFASPIAIPVTDRLRDALGWRATVRLSAVAVIVAFALAALLVEHGHATRSSAASGRVLIAVRRALSDPHARRLLASSILGGGGAAVLIVYQVPLMVAAGLASGTAATLAGARGFAQLLGRLPLSWIIRVLGVRRALRTARAGVGVGLGLVVVAGHPVIAVAFVIVAGTAIGAISPLDGIYARSVLPHGDLGTLMGGIGLLTGVASAATPVIAANLVDASGHAWTAALLGAILAIGSAVALGSAPAAGGGTGPDHGSLASP